MAPNVASITHGQTETHRGRETREPQGLIGLRGTGLKGATMDKRANGFGALNSSYLQYTCLRTATDPLLLDLP